MPDVLQLFILLPLLAFSICLFIPRKQERAISRIAIGFVVLHLLLMTGFIINWAIEGFETFDRKHLVLFKGGDVEIFIDYYFDRVTAVYGFVGSVISLAVTVFSRYYLHRDEGFKRYFAIILLFSTAYNLVVFSGNFETLFMGWEIMGVCSFLLIAFYRDRYLPVKNGLKVISIYRLGDIFLILTLWLSHQLWHENITFMKLNDTALVARHLAEYYWYGVALCIMLIVAAATKSAQLPFSSWLPRAMEGPTTSSAIFYGSLSVHLGVFLLLRTYPYWEGILAFKILVILVGLTTSLVASSIARVQSTVKTQIAYSSICQIGLMFIEVALGLHILALIHFAANAFLRTYQLLVSPSVLSYLIHDMVFSFSLPKPDARSAFARKLGNSIYILSVKEWNLDRSLTRFFWNPFKWLGRKLHFLTGGIAAVVILILFLSGLFFDLYPQFIPAELYAFFPVMMTFVGLILILRAFVERVSPARAWSMVIAAQLFISLAIAMYHDDFGYRYMLLYLSGAAVCAVGGYMCLHRLKTLEGKTDLNRFYGHAYEHPGLAFLFLLSALGLVGFPFTPTFIGVDLLFSHIRRQEVMMIVFISLSFIFMELAVLRIYARLFLGQHVKEYHPIAYKSS